MRVLRIYPGANDPRHRQRDLALTRLGVEVGVVLPERYGDWGVAPVEPQLRSWRAPVRNPGSVPLHLWSQSLLHRAVREFNPDVVDVHEEPYFPSAAQGAIAARGRPFVLYAAQNLQKPLPLPVRMMQRWVLGRAAGCYPCSIAAADLVRSRGFRGTLEVIPLGADDSLFARRRTGSRVGFIGRFLASKGVRDLLSFGPRLLCVGEGPLAGEIRAAGAEIRRARSVEELGGALEEMGALVMPSRRTDRWMEQFGRAAVEAMAMSVPVVAYASGSLPEVVGDAGRVVPEGDVGALHEAIQEVLKDRDDLGERGRARALARYTWPRIAERMVDLYRRAQEGAR